MKAFSISKYSFGRHETFSIRYGWLTKGYQAWRKDNSIFLSDDSTTKLGVGRNMVSSIRYWLIASSLLSSEAGTLESTPIADILMSEDGDIYMEDEATIWIVHWLLASNSHDATVFFWFYNRFHKSQFTSKELFENYYKFVAENYRQDPSEKTLKNDIGVLLRSYHRTTTGKSNSLEENLDSPLAELNLMSELNPGYISAGQKSNRKLPQIALEFAILSVMSEKKVNSIPVSELMHSDGYWAAPGSVFRITEEYLFSVIESITRGEGSVLELRDTAGIRQVYYVGTSENNPLVALRRYYKKNSGGE